jgi:ATP-dependent protease ClpP protease subunit
MSLRKLPEIAAFRMPEVCAFAPDERAFDDWNPGVQAAQTDDNTISMLEVIGEDWWSGGGVTSKRVKAALRAIGDQEVFVDLNSPGGDFFEGVAIYNMLRAHPKKVTVRILSLAASAASVIAMAGDEIQIGRAGFLMVHNAWVVAVGNRHDLADAAKTMEPFDDAMAAVYADRAGVDKVKAVEWMDAETWFNGEQAVAEGLATGLLAADAVKEDQAKAKAAGDVKPVQKVEFGLARAGWSRDRRRSAIGDLMSRAAVARGQSPAVAGDDEIRTALEQLRSTIRS